MPDTMKENERK